MVKSLKAGKQNKQNKDNLGHFFNQKILNSSKALTMQTEQKAIWGGLKTIFDHIFQSLPLW